ncbi:hypothetical protein MBLNU457_6226t1 [Dothideomycetes sp. NU457]
MPNIILLGTLDSKLEEFLYIYDQLVNPSVQTKTPVKVTLIDCGRSPVKHDKISISQSELVSKYGPSNGSKSLMDLPRGEVIKFMTECTTSCLKSLIADGDVHGIISAGGSGGTTLTAAAMREAAPIGMPKIIASTVASGDTGPLVGETDITLMYSVVDIAGSNELLRNVLGNAAGAIIGMASSYERVLAEQESQKGQRKTRIGVTMFGVTTPCVDRARQYLEDTYPVEVFVFHATGHGGRAMERLIEETRLDAVLDITTTEICDFLMEGVMSAGPTRLEAALKAGIPNVISFGATDMVNFGPKPTVPEKYQSRKLYEHNPTVTLMRTTQDECKKIGEFIVEKIRSMAKDVSKVQIRMPLGGVSMIATPGGAFADEDADGMLVKTVKEGLEGSGVRIVDDERDVNNEGFAVDIAEQLVRILNLTKKT